MLNLLFQQVNFVHDRFLMNLVERRGEKLYAGKVIFEEVEPGAMIPHEIGVVIDMEGCQRALDELWRLGFRPAGESTLGEKRAQQEHLSDLREVNRRLFDLLNRKDGG